MLYVLTMAVQDNLFGALIASAATPWYPAYAAYAAAWNLTPREDQQLTGLSMWVAGHLVDGLAAVVLLAAWLRHERAAGRG